MNKKQLICSTAAQLHLEQCLSTLLKSMKLLVENKKVRIINTANPSFNTPHRSEHENTHKKSWLQSRASHQNPVGRWKRPSFLPNEEDHFFLCPSLQFRCTGELAGWLFTGVWLVYFFFALSLFLCKLF